MAEDERAGPISGIVSFLQEAELLKRQTRTAWTADGKVESVAEHSWRVALLVLAMEEELRDLDLTKMLHMAILHDLGEAYGGDISAAHQTDGDRKEETERAGVRQLVSSLSSTMQQRIVEAWEEYARGESAEAQAVKALDKIETIIQHNQGKNPPSFDYRFNLSYGAKWTAAHPAVEKLRAQIDGETEARARQADQEKS